MSNTPHVHLAVVYHSGYGHNHSTSTEDSLNRHGFFLGAAAQSDVDLSAEEAATPADLSTSEHLGTRVVLVVRELAFGRAAVSRH